MYHSIWFNYCCTVIRKGYCLFLGGWCSHGNQNRKRKRSYLFCIFFRIEIYKKSQISDFFVTGSLLHTLLSREVYQAPWSRSPFNHSSLSLSLTSLLNYKHSLRVPCWQMMAAAAIFSKTPVECHQLVKDGYIYLDVRLSSACPSPPLPVPCAPFFMFFNCWPLLLLAPASNELILRSFAVSGRQTSS